MKFEYLDRYKYKIKTASELIKLLGDFPRAKTAILCHGVFDVVHPGHLRHLSYAKSKAEILIVSVTSDRHIKKGIYRPHVPENLRALNLAVLEMVDFVIIDDSATPIENIRRIKPDFFAKGFEYSAINLPAATVEESDAVSEYGGKIVFTPGDLVLSSSRLIEQQAPNLMIDKVISLMQTYKFDFPDVEKVLMEFDKIKVHVIGDTIVDTYTETVMIGGQTKTPTISVRYMEAKSFVGGAGVVALHLKSAGAQVTFTTLLGEDSLAQMVETELTSAGVVVNKITESDRPTTEKNAIICNNYRLLKIDTLDNTPISNAISKEFVNKISAVESDVVVFSDFRHGIFHKQNISELTASIGKEVFKAADSQVASRWGNISDFVGFDLITPNEREARFSIADQDSTIGPLAGKLFGLTQCKNLLLKLGEKGLIGLAKSDEDEEPRVISLDSFTEKAVDPVGAGDALMSYAALTLKVTGSLPMAALVGSLAAACESDQNGNIPIKRSDILEKLASLQSRMGYSST
jgi:rfaE bifunctional protein kinase chain/domain/rfaE bifunctional protein nucleotidyltransferase chain/domain